MHVCFFWFLVEYCETFYPRIDLMITDIFPSIESILNSFLVFIVQRQHLTPIWIHIIHIINKFVITNKFLCDIKIVMIMINSVEIKVPFLLSFSILFQNLQILIRFISLNFHQHNHTHFISILRLCSSFVWLLLIPFSIVTNRLNWSNAQLYTFMYINIIYIETFIWVVVIVDSWWNLSEMKWTNIERSRTKHNIYITECIFCWC